MNPQEGKNAHQVTFVDPHEIDVYAQSDENERERDHERQGALETTYSLGLHEELRVEDEVMWGARRAILALYFTAVSRRPVG